MQFKFLTITILVLPLIFLSTLLTSKTTLAIPLSIYDFMVSDAKFLADVSDYYFGSQKNKDLKRVVRHENNVRNGIQDRCMLPTRKGYCRALIPRFSYDPSQKTCVEFKFGGCDGNANNFISFNQCMDACGKANRRSS
uniref:CSON004868 protein n=1 Tax=Culicoides sonorensis TaxID=179676 RepID=A0A336MP98_CULSO